VTLLGDAAHLIPPDGESANLAMYNGAELGKAMTAPRGDLEAALAKYEETMFIQSARAAGHGQLRRSVPSPRIGPRISNVADLLIAPSLALARRTGHGRKS
jgi:2-polyprenyl-6-methoxyphenol hydroxylase-like FAD-dependent oxidoreductase